MFIEKRVQEMSDINRALHDHPLVLLYVHTLDCGVCSAMASKVKEALYRENICFLEAHLHELPELSGCLLIFSAPCVLFYVKEKEYFRKCGVMGVADVVIPVLSLIEAFIRGDLQRKDQGV